MLSGSIWPASFNFPSNVWYKKPDRTQEGDASAEAIRLGLCFFSSMVFDDLDSKQKQLTLKKFAKLNINLAQPYNGLNTLSNLGQIAK